SVLTAEGIKKPKITSLEVRVRDDGRIVEDGIPPKVYESLAEFQSVNKCVSPPDQECWEKGAEKNLLGHVWGLQGYSPINDTFGISKEGRMWEASAGSLLKVNEDLKIPDQFGENVFNDPDMKATMENALNQVKEIRKLHDSGDWVKAGEEIIRMIETGQPVLIPSGFPQHAVYFTYHNGRLALTNRGYTHSKNQSGTYYFKVDEDILINKLGDSSFVSKLLGNTTKEGFLSFQPYEDVSKPKGFGGKMFNDLGLTRIGFDKKQPQKAGNCSFANCIASMHALANLRSVAKEPLKGGESISDRANQFKVDYKAYTFEVRTRILEASAENLGAEEPGFINDFMQAHTKMESKLKNYEDAGKFGKVSERKKILDMCQHYSAKVNEMAENIPEAKARIEFIEQHVSMHFPNLNRITAFTLLKGKPNKWVMRPSRVEGLYTVAFTDEHGHVYEIRLPDDEINTMEKFGEKFPVDQKLSEEDLFKYPDQKKAMNMYREIQKLSVGKKSATEVRMILKGKKPDTWIIRQSRSVNGQFVLSTVDDKNNIIIRRLTGGTLTFTPEEFYEVHPIEYKCAPSPALTKSEFFESMLVPVMNETKARDTLAACDPDDLALGTYIVGQSPTGRVVSFYHTTTTRDQIKQVPVGDIQSYNDSEIDTLENPPLIYFSKDQGRLMISSESGARTQGNALVRMAPMNNPMNSTFESIKSMSLGKISNNVVDLWKQLKDLSLRPAWLIRESASTTDPGYVLTVLKSDNTIIQFKFNKEYVENNLNVFMSINKFKDPQGLEDEGQRVKEETFEREEYQLPGL
nr:hypothetical protein [Chlamydiota bacterium]